MGPRNDGHRGGDGSGTCDEGGKESLRLDETGAGERVWNGVTGQTVRALWSCGEAAATDSSLDPCIHSQALITLHLGSMPGSFAYGHIIMRNLLWQYTLAFWRLVVNGGVGGGP